MAEKTSQDKLFALEKRENSKRISMSEFNRIHSLNTIRSLKSEWKICLRLFSIWWNPLTFLQDNLPNPTPFQVLGNSTPYRTDWRKVPLWRKFPSTPGCNESLYQPSTSSNRATHRKPTSFQCSSSSLCWKQRYISQARRCFQLATGLDWRYLDREISSNYGASSRSCSTQRSTFCH